jgi:hypothetical protein
VTSPPSEALIAEFRRYGVQRRGTTYFCRRTALEIVDRCEATGIRILGIDGFYLTSNSTQQPIEWILDLSRAPADRSAYNAARNFLEMGIDLPLFYEFVLDGPAATEQSQPG